MLSVMSSMFSGMIVDFDNYGPNSVPTRRQHLRFRCQLFQPNRTTFPQPLSMLRPELWSMSLLLACRFHRVSTNFRQARSQEPWIQPWFARLLSRRFCAWPNEMVRVYRPLPRRPLAPLRFDLQIATEQEALLGKLMVRHITIILIKHALLGKKKCADEFTATLSPYSTGRCSVDISHVVETWHAVPQNSHARAINGHP
ncbi:hypothetical protein BDW69DRAFT_173703 [Aspergillus filifer]